MAREQMYDFRSDWGAGTIGLGHDGPALRARLDTGLSILVDPNEYIVIAGASEYVFVAAADGTCYSVPVTAGDIPPNLRQPTPIQARGLRICRCSGSTG